MSQNVVISQITYIKEINLVCVFVSTNLMNHVVVLVVVGFIE